MQIAELHNRFLQSTGLTTDTRAIAQGNIFFALKGEKFNANRFAAEAFAKGAKYVVVDELINPDWQNEFGDGLILVSNTLQILQQLAGYHRQQLKCPVLAITGSNGKTTTKELVAAVLSKKYVTYATKGNLNNQIGIPLTLLAIKDDVQFAVIEMGANHQLEIASYCQYTAPNYGLITNVGHAHLEGFGGFEGVVKGKTELYQYLAKNNGKVFVNADNPILFAKLLTQITDTNAVISYGTAEGVFCRAEKTDTGGFLSLSVLDNHHSVSISTNLVGAYNFENVLSAICIGKYFGVPMAQIKEAIENYTPANNRSQKLSFGSNIIIADAYNANPSSLNAALKNFEAMQGSHKMVIIGEMMELGEYAAEEHRKIAGQVAAMALQYRVFVGDGFSFLKNNNAVLWFPDSTAVKQWLQQLKPEHFHILIKGSRKNALEKIWQD
ncbi:MAG TPA: UDP-N-acetylmuramoyl-tripeptide--D-alanyl-D-alanine ligase [Chitinophagales bacterium]|nr:UDP-N-acetylmuramoyl-tripeptide--D-alanyl-D-alanine ligase [Chitinophagales bacterium]